MKTNIEIINNVIKDLKSGSVTLTIPQMLPPSAIGLKKGDELFELKNIYDKPASYAAKIFDNYKKTEKTDKVFDEIAALKIIVDYIESGRHDYCVYCMQIDMWCTRKDAKTFFPLLHNTTTRKHIKKEETKWQINKFIKKNIEKKTELYY